MKEKINDVTNKVPSLLSSVLLLVLIFGALILQIFVLKVKSATQITLFLASFATAVVAIINGFTRKEVEDAIMYGARMALGAVFILMLVGILVSTWIAAGTIPYLIYIGLKIISPSLFLFSVCLVCCMGAIATGSSWTTGATFGVAFMGIGYAMNIPPAMTAGAIISGAYFGDKMSPLSDTTNLAAAAANVDLFKHIRSMLFTSVPAIVISLIFYAIAGMKFSASNLSGDQVESLNLIINGMRDNFNLNILCIIPPVMVIVLAIKKFSGVAILSITSIVGMLLAIFLQGYGIGEVLGFTQSGFVMETGEYAVDKLLSRGGLNGMLWTISFAILALTLGGLLEKTKVIEVVLGKVSALTKSQGLLILVHALTSVFVAASTASQYMSVILPGRIYYPAYKKLKIRGEVCSRVCEDSGTIASVMIPWSSCAVYFAGILGVATIEYVPYATFLYLSPILTVTYGFINKFIFKYTDEEMAEIEGVVAE